MSVRLPAGFEPIEEPSAAAVAPVKSVSLPPGFEPIEDSPSPVSLPPGFEPIDEPAPAIVPPAKSSMLRRGIADPLVSLAKGVVSVPEMTVGIADIPTFGMAGKAAESVGVKFKETQEALGALYSPEARQAQERVSAGFDQGIVPGVKAIVQNPSTIVSGAIESTPGMFGGGAIARGVLKTVPALSKLVKAGEATGATKAALAGAQKARIIAGGIGEGAVTAGQNVEQVRQQTESGLLTPKQVALNAGSGALTGLIGVAGGKIANRLGIADVDTLMAGGRKAAGNKLMAVFGGMVQEGLLEELPQSIQEQVAQNLSMNKPWDEGVAQSGAMGAIIGGIMGGGANVANMGMEGANRANRLTKAQDIRRRLLEARAQRDENLNDQTRLIYSEALQEGLNHDQAMSVATAKAEDRQAVFQAHRLANQTPNIQQEVAMRTGRSDQRVAIPENQDQWTELDARVTADLEAKTRQAQQDRLDQIHEALNPEPGQVTVDPVTGLQRATLGASTKPQAAMAGPTVSTPAPVAERQPEAKATPTQPISRPVAGPASSPVAVTPSATPAQGGDSKPFSELRRGDVAIHDGKARTVARVSKSERGVTVDFDDGTAIEADAADTIDITAGKTTGESADSYSAKNGSIPLPATTSKPPTSEPVKPDAPAKAEGAVISPTWRGTVREVDQPASWGGKPGTKLYIPVDSSGKDVSVGGKTILGKTPEEAIDLATRNVKQPISPPAPAPTTIQPSADIKPAAEATAGSPSKPDVIQGWTSSGAKIYVRKDQYDSGRVMLQGLNSTGEPNGKPVHRDNVLVESPKPFVVKDQDGNVIVSRMKLGDAEREGQKIAKDKGLGYIEVSREGDEFTYKYGKKTEPATLSSKPSPDTATTTVNLSDKDKEFSAKQYPKAIEASKEGMWRSAMLAVEYGKKAGIDTDKVVQDLRNAGYEDDSIIKFMRQKGGYGQLDAENAMSRLGSKKWVDSQKRIAATPPAPEAVRGQTAVQKGSADKGGDTSTPDSIPLTDAEASERRSLQRGMEDAKRRGDGDRYERLLDRWNELDAKIVAKAQSAQTTKTAAVKAKLEATRAKPADAVEPETKAPETNLPDQLNAGTAVKPRNATYVRVNGTQVLPASDVDTLKGAGPFKSAEWGIKGRSGFVAMAGGKAPARPVAKSEALKGKATPVETPTAKGEEKPAEPTTKVKAKGKLNSYEQGLVDRRTAYAEAAKGASTEKLTETLKQIGEVPAWPTDGINLMRKQAIEKELSNRKSIPTPLDSLKAKVKVKREGEDTTVSVPAADKPGIAPKEQKKYLLAEIDKAIEGAPAEAEALPKTEDELDAAKDLESITGIHSVGSEKSKSKSEITDILEPLFEKYGIPEESKSSAGYIDLNGNRQGVEESEPLDEDRRETILRGKLQWKARDKYPTVTIEVPGDGTFEVKNDKKALADLRERMKKFPVSTPKADSFNTVSGTTTAIPAVAKRPEGLKGDKWNKLLEPFTSDDETRGAITEVHYTGKGKEIVATDGRRLVVATGVMGAESKHDAKYPNWRQIVPGGRDGKMPTTDGFKQSIEIKDTEKLLRQIAQAQAATESVNERMNTVHLYKMPDGSLVVASVNQTESRSKEEGFWGAEYQSGDVKKGKIIAAFQSEYLREILSFMRKTGNTGVEMFWNDDLSPMLITGAKEYAVLMPVKRDEDTTFSKYPKAKPGELVAVPESVKPKVTGADQAVELYGTPEKAIAKLTDQISSLRDGKSATLDDIAEYEKTVKELEGRITPLPKSESLKGGKKQEETTPGLTRSEFEDMIQRHFATVKDYYSDEGIRNWRDYLEKVDPEIIGIEVDSNSEAHQRYLKHLPDEGDSSYTTVEKMVGAYRSNKLPTSREAKRGTEPIQRQAIPEKGPVGAVAEPVQYEPMKPGQAVKAWEVANARPTKTNKAAVAVARQSIFMDYSAHGDTPERIGITRSELNKKLRSWGNVSASGIETERRMNANAPLEQQWAGITRSSWLSDSSVTANDVDAHVRSIEASDNSGWSTPSGEQLRNYILRAFNAIDTRILYKDLSFLVESTLKPNGLFQASGKDGLPLITIRANSPHTVAHEIGHYLDRKWAREAYGYTAVPATTLMDSLSKNVIADATSKERQQWHNRFHEFVLDISKRSDIGSEYLQDRGEVFARFVSRFVDWTNEKAGKRTWGDERYSNDKFNESDYLRFIQLLQEKAYVDEVDGNPLAETKPEPMDAGIEAEDKDLSVKVDKSLLTPEVLSRMDKIMKREGFDSRSADDVRKILTTRIIRDGQINHPEWANAYREATGGAEKRIANAASKKAEQEKHTNVDRKRLRELGYTANIMEAGYITPDGKLIDLSGKREGGTPGERSYDHREAGGTKGMQEFMAEGNIRMDARSGAVDVYKMPTPKQMDVIERIGRGKSGLRLDLQRGLGKEGDSYYQDDGQRWTGDYDQNTVKYARGDIQKYFDGKIPKTRPTDKGVAMYSKAAPFYSPLERGVQSMKLNQSIPGDQMLNKLRGLPGVKVQEIEESGLADYLATQGKVSKDQVAEFLKQNGVKVEEVVKQDVNLADVEAWWNDEGGANEEKPWGELTVGEIQDIIPRYRDEVGGYEEGATKFDQYAPPGGKNYREVLLTLPKSEAGKPEPVTELPKEYEFITDERTRLGKKWGVVPVSQAHARPIGSYHDTKEGALNEALALINNERLASWAVDRDKGAYTGPHWSEPNVLAHMLMDDRVIPLDVLAKTHPDLAAKLKAEGKTEARALHMIEGQSDLHAKGSAEGYDSFEYIVHKTGYSPESFDNEADAKEYAKKLDETSSKSNQPFERTARIEAKSKGVPNLAFKSDAWKRLVIRTMLKHAVEGNYDLLTWSTGADRAAKWGSERVEWKKTDLVAARRPAGFIVADRAGYMVEAGGVWKTREEAQAEADRMSVWTVAGTEQSGGEHAGMNLEQAARERGLLLEESGLPVRTKDDLRAIVEKILRNPESGKVDKLTDRIWDRMQTEPEGTSMPRREFFEFLYDKSFVNEANDIARKMDKVARVGKVSTKTSGPIKIESGEFIVQLPDGRYLDEEAGQLTSDMDSAYAFDTEDEANAAFSQYGASNIKQIDGRWYVEAPDGSILNDNPFVTESEAMTWAGKTERSTYNALPITPAMKASIEQGQPLYKRDKEQYNEPYENQGTRRERDVEPIGATRAHEHITNAGNAIERIKQKADSGGYGSGSGEIGILARGLRLIKAAYLKAEHLAYANRLAKLGYSVIYAETHDPTIGGVTLNDDKVVIIAKQTAMGHEEFHVKIATGDQDAIDLLDRIDENHPIVDQYAENLKRLGLVQRRAFTVEDIAADIYGGMDQNYGLNLRDALRDSGDNQSEAGEKYSKVKTVTPEQDARYLELAKDPEKNKAELQSMVDEAARKAGAYWHGTASGDLRGGTTGLHVGTRRAATEALEAAIGIPADGKPWDGTRKYGETLLAGNKRIESGQFGEYRNTGYNSRAPEGDYYAKDHPEGFPKHSNGERISADYKPYVRPVLIVGGMSNKSYSPMGDWQANGIMRGMLNRGKAKNGYYYKNIGEDAGSVSAVLPNGDHVRVKLQDPITRDDQGRVIPLSERFNEASPDIRYSKGEPDARTEAERQLYEILGIASDNREMGRAEGQAEGKTKLETLMARVKAQRETDRQKQADKVNAIRGKSGAMAGPTPKTDAGVTTMAVRAGELKATASIGEMLREYDNGTAAQKIAEGRMSLRGAVTKLLKATASEHAQARKELVDAINSKLPDIESRRIRQFLSMLTRSNITDGSLDRALAKIDAIAEKQQKRELVGAIKAVYTKSSESMGVNVLYRQKIKGLMEGFLLTKPSAKTLADARELADFLDNERNSGSDMDLTLNRHMARLIRALSGTPLADMPVASLEDLFSQIARLGTIGRIYQQAKTAGYKESQDAAIERLKANSVPIEEHLKRKTDPLGAKELTLADKFHNLMAETSDLMKKWYVYHMPMDVVFDLLDGAKHYAGENYRQFKSRLDLAFSGFRSEMHAFENEMADKLKELGLTNDKKAAARIQAYAYDQQATGREKLLNTLNPGRSEEGDVEANKILDSIKLTDNEMAFYTWARSKIEANRGAIERVMNETYNTELVPVENYWPMMTDWDRTEKTANIFGLEMDSEGNFVKTPEPSGGLKKNVNASFTIKRKGAGDQILKMDAFRNLHKHIQDVNYYVHVGPTVKYLQEIANRPDYGEAVGTIGQNIVREYLDTMARQGGMNGSHILRWVDSIRNNIGIGTLGLRLSSVLIQPSSWFDGAGMIGGRWAFKGALDVTQKEWREFMWDNMTEIHDRLGGEWALAEATLKSNLAKYGFMPLRVLDELTAGSIAAGAYEKNLHERGLEVDLDNPDAEALAYAQKMVRRTQASADYKDQPLAVTRGALMGGSRTLARAIYQFQTFSMNKFSFMMHDGLYSAVRNKEPMAGVAIMAWTALAFTMEEMIRAGIRAAPGGSGDDQEPEDIAKAFLMDYLQIIPLFGSAVSALQYNQFPAPVIKTIGDMATGAKSMMTSKSDAAKARGAARFGGAVGTMAGIPGTSQAAQWARNTIKSDPEEVTYMIKQRVKGLSRDAGHGQIMNASRQLRRQAIQEGLIDGKKVSEMQFYKRVRDSHERLRDR